MSAELASALRGSDLEQIQRLWQQIQDSIREDRFQDQLFVFQRIVSLMEKQLPALKPLVSDNFWATLKDIQTLDAIFSDAFRKSSRTIGNCIDSTLISWHLKWFARSNSRMRIRISHPPGSLTRWG